MMLQAQEGAAVTDSHPRTSRLALRKIDGAQARLANLVGRGRTAQIEVGETLLQVRLFIDDAEADAQPGEGESACSQTISADTMCFETEHGPLYVASGAVLIRLLTGIELPETEQLPASALRQWITSIAMSRFPASWRALFGTQALIRCAPSPHRTSLSLRLQSAQPDWSMTVQLSATNQTLLAIAAKPAWHAATANEASTDRLRVRKPVVIGRTSLRLGEVQSLARNDLLLVDSADFRRDGQGRVPFGRSLCMGARLVNTGSALELHFNAWSANMDDLETIQSIQTLNEDEPHDDRPSEQPAPGPLAALQAAAPSLDDMTVLLTFEVGALERSIAELKNLSPGCVMQLASALPPQVSVRCWQTEIGRGELVEVDGRLAVLLTELRTSENG